MKLGKLAPKHDPRTLHLANYLNPEALPKIPAQQNWGGKIRAYGVLQGDRTPNLEAGEAIVSR